MKNRFLLKILATIVIGISITSCGGGSGSGNNPGNPTPGPNPKPNPSKEYTTALTISDIGTVPQIENTGIQPVTLYVYNHSDKPISNVKYNVSYVSNNAEVEILSNAMNNCSSIDVGSSCPLSLNAGVVAGTGKGSAIIEAVYISGNTTVKFDQLINFQEIAYINGIQFTSDSKINSYGNQKGHGISYLHAVELISRNYHFTKFDLDNKIVAIRKGDVSGSKVSSSFIHAVVLDSPASNQSIASKLTVNANVSQEASNASSNINVIGSDLGAILNLGFSRAIDTGTNNGVSKGSLPVINNGTKPALITKVFYPVGVIEATGPNKCVEGMKIDMAHSCIIYFNVKEGDAGSGTINLIYSGGNSTTSARGVNWYDSTKTPILNVGTTPSDLFFRMSDPKPKKVILNVSNVGDLSVKLGIIDIKNTGNAKVDIDLTNSTCKPNAELGNTNSCYYVIKVSPISPEENKSITFVVNGTYTNQAGVRDIPYNFITNTTYSSTEDRKAILTLSQPAPMVVTGDGRSSVTRELIVTNNGQFDATNLGFTFEEYNGHNLINIDRNATTCGITLAARKDCKIVMRLQATSKTRIDNSGLFKVTYSGNNTPTTTLDREVSYTVLPMNVNVSLIIDNMPELGVNIPKGDGTQGNPYKYYGNDGSPKFIKFTYRNAGNVELNLENIINHNLDTRAWKVADSSSCKAGFVLQVGALCNVIYQNIIAQTQKDNPWLSPAGIQSINITAPDFAIKTQFGDRLTMLPRMPRLDDPGVLYISTDYAVIQPNARVLRNSFGQLQVGIHATRKNPALSGVTNFTYSFQNKFAINVNSIAGGCRNNGSGEVGKYARGECNAATLVNLGEAVYLSNTYYSTIKDGTEITFNMEMPNDGTYVVLSPRLIKTADLKPVTFGAAAFIGFSTARKVIKCPIDFSSNKILASHCQDIYIPGKEVFSLRLLQPDSTKPNSGKLLIGGDDGLTLYNLASGTVKRLSADWKLNFISSVKDLGNNKYEFFGSTNQVSTYLKYQYDAANDIVLTETQQFYMISLTSPAVAMSYIDRNIKAGDWPLTIIAMAGPLAHGRSSYNCYEDNRDTRCPDMLPSTQAWHKPYRMYQEARLEQPNVWTYTTDWNWGRLDLFKGTLNNQFNDHKPAASIQYGLETGVSDVKSDGTNSGVYVTAVRHSEKAICHYSKDLVEKYCVSAKDLKNDAPTSIEIYTQHGYH